MKLVIEFMKHMNAVCGTTTCDIVYHARGGYMLLLSLSPFCERKKSSI